MLTKKKNVLYFAPILLIFVVFFSVDQIYGSKMYKKIGEKMFLGYHKNDAAIFFLDIARKKNLKENVPDYEIYFLLGRVLFVENRLRESIKNYGYAIEINPDHKESYYGRGLSYGFSSPIFLTDAAADFQKYIDIDKEEFKKTGKHASGLWAGYNDLAWIYFLQGNFKNSEKVALEGLEIAPDSPWLLNMLASTYISLDRCSEALPYAEKAKERMKTLTVEQFGQAYSGDNKRLWAGGRESMIETIQENIDTCSE